MDQAGTLREMTRKKANSSPRKVISITSGKGGVGKTNVVVNLAFSLTRMGKRVLILDADLGLANIDILLGLKPQYHLGHVLTGQKLLSEIIVEGPGGILILPASSGIEEFSTLDETQRLQLLAQMDLLEEHLDLMLIDTAPGISPNVVYFNLVAEEIVVVSSPEPTSIIDAYALIKVLSTNYAEKHFNLLVNVAASAQEGQEVFRNLTTVAERFMDVSIDYLGYVLKDDKVPKAVRQQRPVTELYPDSLASRCFMDLARRVSLLPERAQLKGGIQFFWRHLWEERLRAKVGAQSQ